MDLSLTAKRLGPLLPITTLIMMLLFSMGKWPDPLIDFGRELYVPWAMLQGKQLYTDIFYFNGPLSPYWNLLVFKFLGTGLNSLIIVNICLLCLIVLILFLLLRMASSYGVAVWGSTVFLLLFACSQYTGAGNYNYITPYSHEATHGMLLSLVVLFALGRSLFTKNALWVSFAGFTLGLLFLTKPEFFIAAFFSVATFLVMTVVIQNSKKAICYSVLVVCTMLLPLLISFSLLSAQIPAKLALDGVLGGWLYIGNSQLHSLAFYQTKMGISDIKVSLYTLALSTLAFCVLFGTPIIVGSLKLKPIRTYILGTIPIVSLCIIIWFHPIIPLLKSFARPLPICAFALAVWSFYLAVDRRSSRFALILIFSVFGTTLLGRMLLRVTIYNYGFALAMPAFLISGILFYDLIPAKLRDYRTSLGPYLVSVTAFLVVFIGLYLNISRNIYSHKTAHVGSKQDFFYADMRGYFVNEAVKWINENAAKNATLFVLPEGVMINYLARRISPVPVVNLMPPEMVMFGEKRILSVLKSSPPDYALLVHKDIDHYDSGFFGKGYGGTVYDWITTNYEPVKLLGSVPLKDIGRFGILILKRKEL